MNERNKPLTTADFARVQQQVAVQRMRAASAAAEQEEITVGLTEMVTVLENEVLPSEGASLSERVVALEEAGSGGGGGGGLTHQQVMMRGLGC